MATRMGTLREQIGSIIVGVVSCLCKKVLVWNWWVGAHCAGFGLRPFIQPLLGRYMSLRNYSVTSAVMLFLGVFLSPVAVFKALAWVLPGIVAGYCLQLNSRVFNGVICLAAMVLFCVHPQGALAWVYALYWLIPIAFAVLAVDTLASRSITAALIAHAVGSVIWLYATGMSWQLWVALIPRVAIERGLISCGLLVSQLCIDGMVTTVARAKKRLGTVSAVH